MKVKIEIKAILTEEKEIVLKSSSVANQIGQALLEANNQILQQCVAVLGKEPRENWFYIQNKLILILWYLLMCKTGKKWLVLVLWYQQACKVRKKCFVFLAEFAIVFDENLFLFGVRFRIFSVWWSVREKFSKGDMKTATYFFQGTYGRLVIFLKQAA